SGTSAADAMGQSAGALIGAVTPGAAGALSDGSASLSGTGGYVSAGSPSASLAGDLSLELWINVDLATRQTLISKGYQREFELTLETSGNLNLYFGDGTSWQNVVTSPVI